MQINEKVYAELVAARLPVEQLMKKYGVPGCSLAVIRGAEVTFTGAWGVRDDKGTPLTKETVYECASLTKSVFAYLAMQAVDEKKLELDAPIAPLLPEKPASDDPRYLTITPRHVLSHGSGLPNWSERPMEMLFDPGTSFSYSGEGYFLLQRLLEHIYGKKLDVLMRERVFEPIGMRLAAASWTEKICKYFSYGFGTDGKVVKIRDSFDAGRIAPEPNAAWSLYSWAGDYAVFLCALMNDRGGLSRNTFREMTTRQNHADKGVDWGLGFGIVESQPDVLCHWGDNRGFKSFQIWDKKTHCGVVVNTNSDNGKEFYMDLLKQLTDGDFYGDIEHFIDNAE